MRRLALVATHVLVLCALLPSFARAEFTAATLVSGNSEIPFEQASNPALSGDGRYVVFQGTIAGASGVYRRDLQSGALEEVAGGDAADPSISANGKYVAFSTTADLEPQRGVGEAGEPEADGGCPEVYVRDMEVTPGESGSYTLAAADNGSGEGIIYNEAEACAKPNARARTGAQIAAGVALSADGQRVAFTVLSPSNLTQAGADGGEVVVRDLATRETRLVSEKFNSEDRPTGEAPTGGGGSSASLSADGSTVAWQGTDVPQQVPSARDVTEGMAQLGGEGKEVEPLWRRIGEGPSAVTKRLLAGAGLNFYFTGSHEEAQEIEGGAIYIPGDTSFPPPTLSADGSTVVALANAPTPTNESSYAFLAGKPTLPTDAYVIAVNGTPSSAPQVTPLTATPTYTLARVSASRVINATISSDGTRVAFDTERTSFALAPPSLISPPAPETLYAYTYEANLSLGTLQRITNTFDGSPPNGEPGPMSFSGDGLTLAFGSEATNLIFGTPTSQVSQIYVTHEDPAPNAIATQSVTAAPVFPVPTATWILNASASVQPDGSVLVDAEVPTAGRLQAQLTAQLPVAAPIGGHVSRPTHAAKRSRVGGHVATAKNPKHRGAANTRTSPTLTVRTLAQAATNAVGTGETRLRLRVGSRYVELVHTKYGLYCLLRLAFSVPGRPVLSQIIPLTDRARTSPAISRSSHRVHRKASGKAR